MNSIKRDLENFNKEYENLILKYGGANDFQNPNENQDVTQEEQEEIPEHKRKSSFFSWKTLGIKQYSMKNFKEDLEPKIISIKETYNNIIDSLGILLDLPEKDKNNWTQDRPLKINDLKKYSEFNEFNHEFDYLTAENFDIVINDYDKYFGNKENNKENYIQNLENFIDNLTNYYQDRLVLIGEIKESINNTINNYFDKTQEGGAEPNAPKSWLGSFFSSSKKEITESIDRDEVIDFSARICRDEQNIKSLVNSLNQIVNLRDELLAETKTLNKDLFKKILIE
tara:strand:- start:56 stop:904 length:849 start_codon:yes stop_codon:yes gene_type:complete